MLLESDAHAFHVHSCMHISRFAKQPQGIGKQTWSEAFAQVTETPWMMILCSLLPSLPSMLLLRMASLGWTTRMKLGMPPSCHFTLPLHS